jgi:hypothetical protein
VEEEILLEREQEEKRVFGHGRVVHAGREEQRDAELGARLHVNLVHADAVLGKHLQFRPRFFEDATRDHIVAADVAINISDQRERVSFVEWTAGEDHLPAGIGEKLVMLARRVLERGGREKNFRHGNRNDPSRTRVGTKEGES